MTEQLELEGLERTKSQRLLQVFLDQKAEEFAQGIFDCEDVPDCDCESCRAYYYDCDSAEDPPEQQRLFLTTAAYWVSRMYGGPEEGGWWFDSYTLLIEPRVFMESVVITPDMDEDATFAARCRVRDRIMQEVAEQGYPSK